MTIDRRIARLEWSARANAWVIEDDYDGEFRYEGQPLISLHSLDADARVLHVGTLNKSMFVSLRLAYAVVPRDLVTPLTTLRTQLDGFTPPLGQMTMSLFMDEGHFSSHVRRMRAAYGAKRQALIDGLTPLAERGWTWANNPAGMHLLVQHAQGGYVRSVAAASGLDLALLSAYRDARAVADGLLIRFGALPTADIRAGCVRLLRAARTLK
jgi:GntR family transcriptional regulator/MocR family aminotransferase